MTSIWNLYIDYLWNYDSNSSVATIAYIFRIWAILAILPTLALALLDVTSYVIARTLGDPTASTSHKSSFATQPIQNFDLKVADAAHHGPPSPTNLAIPCPIPIKVTPPQDNKDKGPPSSSSSVTPPVPAPVPAPGARTPSAFFVDGEEVSEDDGAARLAGVGVFSPVASMPGSPVASRRGRLPEREGTSEDGNATGASSGDESGLASSSPARGVISLRGRGQRDGEEGEGDADEGRAARGGTDGGGSTSGGSSFALLDREESFEDAGTHIRRRVQGTTGAVDDDDDD
ncbi:hypothetical protein F5148DRAFT_1374003 [Russula earlei]|uniref:Uncharacterized protein n=1 Tax=Russula earlei TaxID=71964 RepID=A0ACC0UI42_9AGAM|nr:hypothetical protein F5148DRAFT_1374003 [Russula earlei]